MSVVRRSVSEFFDTAFIRRYLPLAKLLEKADEYYALGKEYESIAHQVQALCIGFRSKFHFSKDENENRGESC